MTKSGPSDPVFITKILQKIQENMGTSLKHIIFISENLKFDFEIFESPCTSFVLFFLKFEYLIFIIICEDEDREMIKIA